MEAIILLGGPGAGKGTLAETLKTETDYLHTSTGNMLRAAISDGSELGLAAKSAMDAGELVSDEIVLGIIRDRMKQGSKDAKFMFDGFPRTIEQAEGLQEICSELGCTISHVFNLEVPQDELLTRLTGRRTCKKCGAIYHMKYNPPKDGELCDVDGGELFQRDDDKEETILNRLKVYDKQTSPLIDYYRERKVLRDINADAPIPTISAAVLAILKG